ncbi:MAG: response regulator [Candidatus Omnitrophota bacterium]|jgi:CheY-like chemotaxis protein|nr:MAG: response regulator [Candidatus Omnitrophota bacterium]
MSEVKILVVDDEKELAESMIDLLEFEGYTTVLAGTGEDALESIAHSLPDLVVLDIKLPGIDGIEVLRRLKQEHPALPVIIVSASSQKGTREQAQDFGADGVLLKPFDQDELLQLIKTLV